MPLTFKASEWRAAIWDFYKKINIESLSIRISMLLYASFFIGG